MVPSGKQHVSRVGAYTLTDTFPDIPAGPGGLLPWQGLLLGTVCGIFAFFHPLSGAAGLVVLWLAWVCFGGRARIGVAMLAAFAAGLLLAWLRLPALPELPALVDGRDKVQLEAVVDAVLPQPDRRLNVLLRNAECRLEDGSVVSLPGKVLWSWHRPSARVLPGQSVRFYTRVKSIRSFGNPGAWDYALAQRMQHVFLRVYSRADRNALVLGARPFAPAGQWRIALTKSIEQATCGQGGAMLAALLTGDRFGLRPETIALVRAAGLSHTLALSGLHLGFVVMLGYCLAWGLGCVCPPLLLRIPRPKLAVLTSAPLVLGYLWLGGFSPSLLRSSLMFAFMAFFLFRGRGRVVMDGLFFALLVILLFDPLAALDIRLQLSAVAVAGIGIFLPALLRACRNVPGMRLRLVRWSVGILAVSLCATLCILPVSARTFGMFAPNVLLNVIWLPLLGFVVMPAGLVGLLLSLFSLPAGAACFAFAGKVMGGMLAGLSCVEQAGLLPMVQLLRPLWPELLGAGVLLAALAASMRLGMKQERNLWAAVALGLVLMFAPQVQVMATDATSLRLEVVDVGQGQALVLTAPGGHRCVIDGGGFRSRTFDAGRNVLAPFLTLGRPPRIDTVVLTHPDMDHYKGLMHLLRYFDVARFYHGGSLPGGSYKKRFRDALGSLEAVQGGGGDVLTLGDGLYLETLHPARGYTPCNTNDASLVQRLVHDGQGLALLCGDAEITSMKAMLAAGVELSAQVLVLPHHGSQMSYLPVFYRHVMPQVAFCSSGYRNKGIHPSATVVNALSGAGCPVLSTWGSGLLQADWVQPSVAGPLALRVETFR